MDNCTKHDCFVIYDEQNCPVCEAMDQLIDENSSLEEKANELSDRIRYLENRD
jgi:hypothetical protein